MQNSGFVKKQKCVKDQKHGTLTKKYFHTMKKKTPIKKKETQKPSHEQFPG
jgi:hypothetical protein